MKRYQDDVREFMVRMGQPFAVFDFATRALRDRLIREETEETINAIVQRNMIETIDGLCDSAYVGIGAGLAFGIDVAEHLPGIVELSPADSNPSFIDPEQTAALLNGAKTLVSFAIDQEDRGAITSSLVGYLSLVFSSAARFGISIRPFWEEVHRSNLAKADGPVRADGKKLKPAGWVPPDLQLVYTELYGVSGGQFS